MKLIIFLLFLLMTLVSPESKSGKWVSLTSCEYDSPEERDAGLACSMTETKKYFIVDESTASTFEHVEFGEVTRYCYTYKYWKTTGM